MLHDYLRSSSVHGLRYLSTGHWAARSLWACCIAASFSLAGVIIRSNFNTWQNQPSIITSVDHELIEDQRLMPVVMVCPVAPNANDILRRLLLRDPGLLSDETAGLAAFALIRACLKGEIRRRVDAHNALPREVRGRASGLLAPCQSEDSEGCRIKADSLFRLVRFLASLKKAFGHGERFAAALEAVKFYLATLPPGWYELSFESFANFTFDYYGITTVSTDFEVNYYKLMGVDELYLEFFPMFDDTNHAPLPLRGLSDFKSGCDVVEKESLGNAIAYLIDTGYVSDLAISDNGAEKSIVAKVFFEVLDNFLNVDSPKVAMTLLNMVAYGRDQEFFVEVQEGRRNVTQLPCPDATDYLTLKRDVCQERSISDSESKCEEYCQSVQLLTEERTAKVLEILWLGVSDHGLPEGGDQASFLPLCQLPNGSTRTDSCWRQVVNDRGVCLAANADAGYSEIIGSSRESGLVFPMDVGGAFYVEPALLASPWTGNPHLYHPPGWKIIIEKVRKNGIYLERNYDILVSQQNHFTNVQLMKTSTIVAQHAMNSYQSSGALDMDFLVDSVVDVTDQFLKMSPRKRGCFTDEDGEDEDEARLDLFPAYSESNCRLECVWKKAADQCGCVPWFLSRHMPKSATCEAHGNRCFRTLVESRYDRDGPFPECHQRCLPDCKRVLYTVRSSLRYGSDSTPPDERHLETEYLASTRVSLDFANLTGRMDLSPLHEGKNLWMFRLFPANKFTLRIVKTATMTLADLVCNVGGAMGLFCGFSILSAVEGVYWIAKGIFGEGKRAAAGRKKTEEEEGH